VVRKQQCLVVPSAVEDVDDLHKARSDPIEDQIVCEGQTVIQQFLDKACGAPGIVRPDVVSNSDEIALRRSRNDDFHTGAQAFPARR